jgi:hypothetical protein
MTIMGNPEDPNRIRLIAQVVKLAQCSFVSRDPYVSRTTLATARMCPFRRSCDR